MTLWIGYRFIRGDAIGNIWTTFQRTDTGTLSFVNCLTGGKVKVYLDGKAIVEATALQRKNLSTIQLEMH